MTIQNLLLFLILVTLLTYVFMPWKNNERGMLVKSSFKIILIWWISLAVISGIVIFGIISVLSI